MKFALSVALCAIAAHVVDAGWEPYDQNKADKQVSGGCGATESCLGAIFEDSDIEGLCNDIIDDPCGKHSFTVGGGLVFWAPAGDCNADNAKPTADVCYDYFIGVRAEQNDIDCGVSIGVDNDNGDFVGAAAVSGSCIPIDPIG